MIAEPFHEWARASLPWLLGMARAVTGDPGTAEDVTQEVLIKVHGRWAGLRGLDHFEPYVRRMIVNEALTWRRKWSRLIPDEAPGETGAELDTSSRYAERDAIFAALRRLPPRQRAVLGLRFFADLSDEQIAEDLGCAPATVRVHAARALASLRSSSLASSPLGEGHHD